eukprot:tig00000241_g21049.t1
MVEDVAVARSTAAHDVSSRFVLERKAFQQQYSSLYFVRLKKLERFVRDAAQKKWQSEDLQIATRTLDIKEGQRVILTGTMYKEMPQKPSILKQLEKDRFASELQISEKNFVDKDDVAILEDAYGRVRLVMQKEQIDSLVTGVIVALMGSALASGEFQVEDICFAGIPAQVPAAVPASPKPKYVALVSGLRVGEQDRNPLLSQLLVDYFTGQLGSSSESLASQTVRIIVAGDSLLTAEDAGETSDQASWKRTNANAKRQQASLAAMVKDLDMMISELCTSLPVDVMPGGADPSNNTLPQQPMHRCLLPLSAKFSTFNAVTNPYECKLDGKRLLGVSGQTIEDILKYTTLTSPLDALERTLEWRHIAPTAPDTLGCYPYHDEDPFIISECPDLYFAGNQSEFGTKLVTGPQGQKCRLVTIPTFAQTGSIVLVNLVTLDVERVTLEAAI